MQFGLSVATFLWGGVGLQWNLDGQDINFLKKKPEH